MLLGEYEHTIDDKNRLTLPARFREQLAGGVVVTRGMDGCLYAYPAADWRERLSAALEQGQAAMAEREAELRAQLAEPGSGAG